MSSRFSIANHDSGLQYIATGGPQNNNACGPQYNNFYYDLSKTQDDETNALRAEKEACLRSLSFPNLSAREHDIERAIPRTCDWLFETAEFQKWRDRTDLPTHNGVLWIKGKPGAGKSTLMKHTLRYWRKAFKDHLTVAYFFNARGHDLEKTPQGMLQSIVYQLLKQDATLCEQFVPIFREQQIMHNGRDFKWQQRQLEDEFVHLTIEQPQSRPLLLLVDALDECNDPEVRKVVKFLETLSVRAVHAGVQLSVCLSSRHYPHISIKKTLSLTVEESEDHEQDIAIYVEQNLMVRNHDIEAGIQEKAEGIFMWVVIVVNLLNQAYDDGQDDAMRKTLEEVPADLEEVFDIILNKHHSNKAETILMFQWVLLSQRPLNPKEIFAAVVGTTLPTSDVIRRRITASSKGLIEVRSGDTESRRNGSFVASVQFIHLSVADFLCRNRRLQTLDWTLEPDPIAASHGILWAHCWSCIEQLDTTVTEQQHIRSLINSHPFLGYAARHIFDHAEKALSGRKENELSNGVESLIDPYDTRMSEAIKQCLRKQNDWFRWWKVFLITTGAEGDKDINAGILYMFSTRGYLNLTRLLLEQGADVNAQGGEYGNALQAATLYSSQAIVELLLAKGADVNAQGRYYGNALQAAAFNGNGGQAMVKLLLAKGADVNAQGGEYGNALQAAVCGNGGQAIVELLLAKGADVNAQGGYYGNVLQAAAFNGNDGQTIVELLLAKGADVNAQGGYYGNALQAAAFNGNGGQAIVELLLAKGADVNA